jgi:hypothetical protein
MHFDMACDWWVCPGWDGEGCPAKVTEEELDRYRARAARVAPPGGPGRTCEPYANGQGWWHTPGCEHVDWGDR